ncbi:MAG: DSD1 family PLP-dependent enzyme [Thermomicrobiales bacterium]|nr:DSD1 family PLP-dependent enzyme [Thermomicrobiales bacterium]
MYTTVVGRPVSELDTPALLIDLDVFERNIATMAADIAARGANWRPHSKAHKTPAIAHKLIAAGAIGVTCAKVGEAEVMVANGVKDVLIANQVVGPIKTRRLAALCRQGDVIVAVDNPANVDELNEAALAAGSRPRIVIEVNVGMERCGIGPGAPAVELAKRVADKPGLRFAGVMAWEGHAMGIKDSEARKTEVIRACQSLVDTAEACRAAGLPVEVVSAGGTGTYLTSAGVEGITEVEAGGGIWGDVVYRDLGANVSQALQLMMQVTSRPNPTRVITDSGRKSLDPSSRQPSLRGLDTTGPFSFSAEHCTINLTNPSDTPKIGERLFFDVGYSDQCNHLHEYFFGIRNGIVETVWPIAARGRLQ